MADFVGVAVVAGLGTALAHGDRSWITQGPPPPDARLVWWRAATTAPPLVAAGTRPRACWDLGAVHRLLYGGRRDDPAAVFSPGREVCEPPRSADAPTLLDLVADVDPVRADGSLSPDWAAEPWAARGEPADLQRACRWAALALDVQRRQQAALSALPDPRPSAKAPPLALLTAYAESAAALLAVELEHDGLPVDRAAARALLTAAIGDPPTDQQAARAARDARVLKHFPGPADLRNPLQVRELLLRIGIDVKDTRSWRLEPHRATSPAVAALLDWRKTERIATTYGWEWLARHVGPDNRLRGSWGAADAAAGRMTASAGLHNLPAELRPAIAAPPGRLLVRADLGQVEPRVLAVVSGDTGLAAAAREQDMYAPVAAQLGADRPTAKIAVLAAMYGLPDGPGTPSGRRGDRPRRRRAAHLGRPAAQVRRWRLRSRGPQRRRPGRGRRAVQDVGGDGAQRAAGARWPRRAVPARRAAARGAGAGRRSRRRPAAFGACGGGRALGGGQRRALRRRRVGRAPVERRQGLSPRP